MVCLGCQVVNRAIDPPGGLILEGQHWIVNHAISPAPLVGMLIVQTRRHVEHIGALSTDEADEMEIVRQRTHAALQQAVQPERIYVCSFGERVPHIHWWLVPRYSYISIKDFEGLHDIIVQRRYTCSYDEARRVAHRVRALLQEDQQ